MQFFFKNWGKIKPTVTKFCMLGRVGDVITGAKFYGNRLRDFGVTGPPYAISIKRSSPYNSVSATVLHCEKPIQTKTRFTTPRRGLRGDWSLTPDSLCCCYVLVATFTLHYRILRGNVITLFSAVDEITSVIFTRFQLVRRLLSK